MFGRKKTLPEVYQEAEMDALESHIQTYFGKFTNVLHEDISPDIHVDIYIVEPTPERNYYTLVTMGMGARKMNVPKALRKERLERAELLFSLPPDWNFEQLGDAAWFWPIRWLKILARLPGEHDTWLGRGHTIPAGQPLAENTELCGMLLTMPYFFDATAATCTLPGGDTVNFYQLVPLYENEMEFKINHGVDALEEQCPEDFDMVLDLQRPNFLDRGNEDAEVQGCIASKRRLADFVIDRPDAEQPQPGKKSRGSKKRPGKNSTPVPKPRRKRK